MDKLKKILETYLSAIAYIVWAILLFLWTGIAVIGPYEATVSPQLRLFIFMLGLMVWFIACYYWHRYKQTSPKRFEKPFTRSLRDRAATLRDDVRLERAHVTSFESHLHDFRAAASEFLGNNDICLMTEKLEMTSTKYLKELQQRHAQGTNGPLPNGDEVIAAADKIHEFTKWVANNEKH